MEYRNKEGRVPTLYLGWRW